jgi:DNA-binding NtrC family response regulator
MLTLELRKVLVVDEAAPVRRKLLDILHRAGIPARSILMATRPEEALEIFALSHPSLVFTELVGPPGDGVDMVLEMLELDPQARVVLVTAEPSDDPGVRRAIRAGAFSVLSKPLRTDVVRALLAEVEAEDSGIERFR